MERNYKLLSENKLLILQNNQCWHPSTEEKLRVSLSGQSELELEHLKHMGKLLDFDRFSCCSNAL